jgi:hypothetical protein
MMVHLLADAAGLLLHRGRSKDWRPGRCPAGCHDGVPDRKVNGCNYSAEGFHCHRCGAKGGWKTLAELLGPNAPGLAELGQRPYRKARKPKPGDPWVHVGWDELQAAPGWWRSRVERWCTEVRGWHPEIARAVAVTGDVAAVPSEPVYGATGKRLVRYAERSDRHILLALRDAGGAVRSVERRWHLAAKPDDGKAKALQLDKRATCGEDDRWGVLTFGRLLSAVEALERGGIVAICEGGPDALAADAALRSTGLGVALGGVAWSGMEKAAGKLAELLRYGAAPRGEVVVVPHRGDTEDVGWKAGLKAAEALRGLTAVRLAKVPTDAEGKGDLADLAATGLSPTELAAFLADAELLHHAPVALADAPAALERTMADAVEKAGPERLIVVQVTAGAGKSREAEKLLRELAPHRPVVLAAHSHDLAAELVPGDDAIEGAARNCRRFKGLGSEDAEALKRAFSLGRGHGPCGLELPTEADLRAEQAAVRAEYSRTDLSPVEREAANARWKRVEGLLARGQYQCPEVENGCEGAEAGQVKAGRLWRTVHAAVPTLGKRFELAEVCACGFKVPEGAATCEACGRVLAPLLVVDELPSAVIERAKVTPAALRTLYIESGAKGEWWRQQNPSAGEWAAKVEWWADELACEYQAEGDRYGVVYATELLDLLNAEGVRDRLRPAALAFLEDGPKPPPVPVGERLRMGLGRWWPSGDAFDLVKAVARAVVRPDEAEEALRGWSMELPPRREGEAPGAVWTLREPYKAPEGWSVVVLDATADRSRVEWEAVATASGRELVWLALDVSGGRPRAAVHVQCKSTRAGQLWARGAGRVSWFERAGGALKNAFGAGLRAVREAAPEARKLGILAHKPIADALRVGLGQIPADGSEPAELLDLAAELTACGFELAIGHWHAQDRGTRTFEGVEAMICVGPAAPNLGAMEAEAALLGCDRDELVKARTDAAHVQGLSRPRHLRRTAPDAPVLVFVGPYAPTGADLPSVIWRTVELDAGRHAEDMAAVLRWPEVLAAHAEAAGLLVLPDLVKAGADLGLSRALVKREAQSEANRRGWIAGRVTPTGRGRPATAWGEREKLNVSGFFAAPAHTETEPEAGREALPFIDRRMRNNLGISTVFPRGMKTRPPAPDLRLALACGGEAVSFEHEGRRWDLPRTTVDELLHSTELRLHVEAPAPTTTALYTAAAFAVLYGFDLDDLARDNAPSCDDTIREVELCIGPIDC